MNITTRFNAFARLFATNSVAVAITNLVPTFTKPSGNGVLDVSKLESNVAQFVFYGTRTAADNETFIGVITTWKPFGGLWIPLKQITLTTLTQGTSTGDNSSDVEANEYFADTIVGTSHAASAQMISPGGEAIAQVLVDLQGALFVQAQLARGTNASCNCLCSTY